MRKLVANVCLAWVVLAAFLVYPLLYLANVRLYVAALDNADEDQ